MCPICWVHSWYGADARRGRAGTSHAPAALWGNVPNFPTLGELKGRCLTGALLPEQSPRALNTWPPEVCTSSGQGRLALFAVLRRGYPAVWEAQIHGR